MKPPKKDDFPEELRVLDQWVCWDEAKVPRQCALGSPYAKANLPDTWGTFYDCRVAAGARENLRGVGFVLTSEDPFAVVDLDGARCPLTGKVSPKALALVERFDSLTYISQSGTGFHIWLRLTEPLPGTGKQWTLSLDSPVRDAVGIEIYDRLRYIACSGEKFRDKPIQERTELFHKLHAAIEDAHAKKVAKARPVASVSSRNVVTPGPKVELWAWLDRNGISYRTKDHSQHGVVYQLLECPFGSKHTDRKDGPGHAVVFSHGGDGVWCFSCCHTHCADRGWREFSEAVSLPSASPRGTTRLAWGRRGRRKP